MSIGYGMVSTVWSATSTENKEKAYRNVESTTSKRKLFWREAYITCLYNTQKQVSWKLVCTWIEVYVCIEVKQDVCASEWEHTPKRKASTWRKKNGTEKRMKKTLKANWSTEIDFKNAVAISIPWLLQLRIVRGSAEIQYCGNGNAAAFVPNQNRNRNKWHPQWVSNIRDDASIPNHNQLFSGIWICHWFFVWVFAYRFILSSLSSPSTSFFSRFLSLFHFKTIILLHTPYKIANKISL